jgi:hypothetical protein
MTLLDRVLARGVQLPVDPIVAARVERHLRRIQPDPMFRRRLRGLMLNRYVANREGMVEAAPPPSRRREMGALGRGVLVGSLLTAMGVSAVGAAAQESLPGDALYAVKLQLEELRMRVAPPGLRDDLAAIALDERLEEVERLAAAGRWQLVDAAAARAAQAEQELAAITNESAAGADQSGRGDAIESHVQRLEELIVTAPASATDGLKRALEASTEDRPPAQELPAADPTQGGQQPADVEEPETPAQASEAPPEPSSHSPETPR